LFKAFLLKFKNVKPQWQTFNYADFPSVQWKLQNLKKLKEKNPEKHAHLYKLPKNFGQIKKIGLFISLARSLGTDGTHPCPRVLQLF
jgi:hypothetical protein